MVAVKRISGSRAGHVSDCDAPGERAGLTFRSVAPLLLGWTLLTLVAFIAADASAMRFFDLPLAAFFAGQGALVGGAAIVGIGRRMR